ncbi:MAG: hypothetical protein IPL38_03620 [Rhodobacter sp.]|jgi:hypothetical protein|nr:hypothetical protein [Rhodobacter sp.]
MQLGVLSARRAPDQAIPLVTGTPFYLPAQSRAERLEIPRQRFSDQWRSTGQTSIITGFCSVLSKASPSINRAKTPPSSQRRDLCRACRVNRHFSDRQFP